MAKKQPLTEVEVVSKLLYAVVRVIAQSDDPLKLYLEADTIYNQAIDDCVQEQILQVKNL